MPNLGNQYHLIIYSNDKDGPKVLQATNGLWEVEVDGNNVRHKFGEIRDIKHPFVVIDDRYVADKIKKGDAMKPEWMKNDEKPRKIPKAQKEANRMKALEDRLQALEDKLAKLEGGPNT
ncbi:hypothetical protein SAMN05660649_04360 [Desulfotomaculum arcticum]|uniref:Uncharacterized protein n=1 Tax=Desulfotruncus arcticus DSM 17038 TaxID=1121424 RepID=A0A1I2YBY6_9FIRM|nr:hypothetical protein [Desulfotruncus arcticus]SFH22877.1 hypothetical protein SAMN05660649_04360 [Desulfotomaculum arcticum] [Desulfotruncus arcticus DSM 17038]